MYQDIVMAEVLVTVALPVMINEDDSINEEDLRNQVRKWANRAKVDSAQIKGASL